MNQSQHDNTDSRFWQSSEDDVRAIALGCGVLGCGGGGNTMLGEFRALSQLRRGKSNKVATVQVSVAK